ncbi:MAG: antibiotic biosynthesis monooxygenase [Leucobacter sp.]|nr:antibiotic biosynthesis monooxygenase [Leucobacter sp.]
MAFVVNAVWRAKPGSEAIVADAIANLVEASRAEPGNRYYQPYQSADEPGVFRFFEVYDDEDAFKAHGESEHFQKWGFGVAIPELEDRVREFFVTLD